ncbi:MAG TPA: hypothetical protein VNT60_03190 [Deinococcales bacterium]|nr:hypothetical protein [Deinococcales bacterium]
MTTLAPSLKIRYLAGPASATLSAALTLVLLAGAPSAHDESRGRQYRLDASAIAQAPAQVVQNVRVAVEVSARGVAGAHQASEQ